MTLQPQHGSTAPTLPWDGDTAEAPLAAEPRALPRQLALFAPEDLAPAEPQPEPRRKRLPRPDAGTPDSQATADWLESFFDVARNA